MQSPNELSPTETLSPTSNSNQLILSLVIGFILLLPLLYEAGFTRLIPALQTVSLSQTNFKLIRGDAEFIGMQNFERLFQDRAYTEGSVYTLLIVVARLVVVGIIPVLVGLVVGAQHTGGRVVNRLLLSLIAVLISPVALAVLWSMFWGQLWGRQPSPLFPPPSWLFLGDISGARISTLLVDVIVTAAIAAVVGGTVYMAVMRGRSLSPSASQAGLGVWLIGALLVVMGVVEPFVLPFVITAGGPARATTSLAMTLYDAGFRRLDFGYGAAQSVLMLLPTLLVIGIWGVLFAFRLRLRYAPAPEPHEMSGGLTVLSLLLLVLIGLPMFILTGWGLWLSLFSSGGLSLNSFQEMLSGLGINWGQALINTVVFPWLVIWLIQVPVTWLAGLALGFVRPLGWVFSNLVFLFFLLITFIPPEALLLTWYKQTAEAKLLNTLPILGMPWLVSGISLLVFKLFFDGAHERYTAVREQGQHPTEAFINTVFLPSLPIVLVVGVLASFASVQNLLWSLLVSTDKDLLSVPVQLVRMRGAFVTQTPLISAAAIFFMAVMAGGFILIVALLQVFVLDRLALIAGGVTKRAEDKPKPAAALGLMDTA